MTTTYDDIQHAAAAVHERIGARRPALGLILGSGLGSFAERLEDAVAIHYKDIPGFPVSTVVGHAGRLVVGSISGLTCVAMQGRSHMYEGHSAAAVAFPARTLIALGARSLIITNAAGGIRRDLLPGDLMIIRDHINLFPESPLTGPVDPRLGPRFPDMTRAYSPRLIELCRAAAKELSLDIKEGVYAGAAGPQYETPAEVKRLAAMGADATGMSTIPEVLVARQMDAEVLGISCITNAAAGITGEALSHDEVTETAARVRATFESLIAKVIARIASADPPSPPGSAPSAQEEPE